MPLSEHEQRQLEQIEQALYSEDPKFVHAVRSSDPRVHYKRRAYQAAAGFVLGVGLLLGGVISQFIWVGVAGFVVMLVCCMWWLTSWRHINALSAGALGPARPKKRLPPPAPPATARGRPGAPGGQPGHDGTPGGAVAAPAGGRLTRGSPLDGAR